MSGETEAQPSAWTIDSVRESMGRQLDALRDQFRQQIDDLRSLLDERYETQTKANSVAFEAAEKAVQCVSMDTPILCADLLWRPAGDLLVGDELIAFDEHDPGTPRGRRFRRSVVTGNAPRRDALLRVTTDRGSVRCNRQHPFLARFVKERWRWVRAEDLTGGEQVMYAVDVWEHDRSWDAGWLAGMFDGEGCLSFKNGTNGKARLSIVQSVGIVADQLESVLKERCPSVGVRQRAPIKETYKAKTEFEINARVDIMRMLGMLRPLRLLDKADAVWEDFPISGNARAATVTSVETAGTGMIASLSTSTGTYIAAGFAVHNTALLSAEKAVVKAEVAADKRFDSVNEFRGQLNDQARTFMPRSEAETRLVGLAEKIEGNTARNVERIRALELRAESQPNHAEVTLASNRINEIEVRMQTLISRVEIDTLNNSSIARITELSERLTNLELNMSKALERGAGLKQGAEDFRDDRRMNANLAIAGLGALLLIVSTIFAVYAAVHK